MENQRKGVLIEDEIQSTLLKETIPLIIYLPEHYSPLYSYPVIYLQDGEDYIKLGKIVTTLDELISNHTIGRSIAVAVPVPDKEERYSRYHPQGEKYHAYKRFFAEELVTYIDTNYATHPIHGARAIAGESLGGAISLDIALQYPYTFHQVITQSGAFYDETVQNIKDFSQTPSLLQIYQSIGKQETKVETSMGQINLLKLNQEVKELLESIRFPIHYHEFDGDHTWGYWQDDFKLALSTIWKK